MKHTFFEIRNFKGIMQARLDFEAKPRSNVYTLVGLNESGKTTILEAIDFLKPNQEKVQMLELPGYSLRDPRDLIPMEQRDNFNGDIEIKVGYQFEKEDQEKLREFFASQMQMELIDEINVLHISRRYTFKNSVLQKTSTPNHWDFSPVVRRFRVTKSGKRTAAKTTQTLTPKIPVTEWAKILAFVQSLLPSVLYFPNFLFDFPNKIYLEDAPTFSIEAQDKHRTYRAILQDVLDSMGGEMTLATHILGRAKSGDSHDRKNLESVRRKMASNITKTVFDNWNRIFGRSISNKQIEVECEEDSIGWYLQLRLSDGAHVYEISERSLGFRWFFAFMLLTQYRGFRKDAPGNVLFLLDEPASNLHPSAQRQLLDSFEKMQNCSIVYTTHSHHLINPAWLESTFVVKNAGLDYGADKNADDNYDSRDTNITLERYRTFVDNHPQQITYFQPVLDVLDYRLSELENVPNVVMMEGKNDFYTLHYAQKALKRTNGINLMPGTGSGHLDAAIRLYVGWGRNFIVLLDSDAEGQKQKRRYQEMFGPLIDKRIFCLKDIESSWKRSMESLFSDHDRLAIQQKIYPKDTTFHKDHFNRAIQELFSTKGSIALSSQTKENFKSLLDFCTAHLKQS